MFPCGNTSFTRFLRPSLALPYSSVVTRNSNPRWVVDCRNCLASFTHSEIGRDRKLVDYLIPTAPALPQGGQEMECPSCKTKALYTSRDLRYRYR